MSTQIQRHYEEEVLPGFSLFRHLTRGENPVANMTDFGYLADCRPKFNAFSRRFRVACNLKSVEFESFGESTADGYQSMIRHFVMFSAFERYAQDCEGIDRREYHTALAKIEEKDFSEAVDFLKEVDGNNVVWDFLIGQKENHYQGSSMLSFRNGFTPKKAVYLSAMLRNTFAHGVLTATPYGAEPGAVKRICDYMYYLFKLAIQIDFQRRLQKVLNEKSLRLDEFEMVSQE